MHLLARHDRGKGRIAQPEGGFADADAVERSVGVHVKNPEAGAEDTKARLAGCAPVTDDGNVVSLSKREDLIGAGDPLAIAVDVETRLRAGLPALQNRWDGIRLKREGRGLTQIDAD